MFKEEIKSYYSRVFIKVPEIQCREFGYGTGFKKIVTRHIKFKNNQEFNLFLRQFAPRYVSYSVAYYRFPDARKMDEKEYLGRDLVIDIDIDELQIPEVKKYSITYCKKCKKVYKDLKPVCDCGEKTLKILFYSDELDEIAKRITEEVIDILKYELGFKKLSINFSGNRGYHIHYREKLELDEHSLIELLDYLMMRGFDYKKFFIKERKRNFYLGPPAQPIKIGPFKIYWPNRIGKILKLRPYGIDVSGIDKGVYVIENPNVLYGVAPFHEIDSQTFIDKYRLIRVPNTIHGDTMMIAKEINNLKSFNPWRDAVIKGRYLKIKVPIFLEGTYGGKTYEEITGEVYLPKSFAMYICCKFQEKLVS